VAPTRQVPCLEIDGQRFFQSVAIIEYLDETRPTPPLLPREAPARARVRMLVEVVNSVIQPLHNYAVRERLKEQFGVGDGDARAWSRYWIERRFEALDRILGDCAGRYAFGDAVTLADVLLYPQAKTSRRFDVDIRRYATIAGVVSALETLPAFRDSDPPPAP
jgi:maleylacetoacetate isomerase